MRVLGIDPGLRITGYGCLEGDGVRAAVVEAGVVRLMPKSGPTPSVEARLLELDRDLAEMMERLRPDLVAVEALFAHYDHPATAVKMAHARGVILLAARRAGVELAEITPAEVKRAVTGSGRAQKGQMQESVRALLGIREPLDPPDVADALGIAMAAAARSTMPR